MEYLHNDKERFLEAINLVVYQTGISAEAVEKDYYVTMILRHLAEKLSFVVFKGGTSLSKCHQVIKRFSEDIDVTIDMSLSQGQKKKVKTAIVEIVEMMGLEIRNLEETRSRRDYNIYVNVYDYYLQNKVKKHSRHIYDIYKLLPLVPQDDDYCRLVQEVRKVRKMSPVCPSAQDGVDIPALLGAIIKESAYKTDYQNLTEGLLEEKVSYEMAVKALEKISESQIFG